LNHQLNHFIMYIKNSSGPKTVPWGTPDVVATGADYSPPILPQIGYAVLETIRTSYEVGHEFRNHGNDQVSSRVGDGELCRMLMKNRGLRRELFCWTG